MEKNGMMMVTQESPWADYRKIHESRRVIKISSCHGCTRRRKVVHQGWIGNYSFNKGNREEANFLTFPLTSIRKLLWKVYLLQRRQQKGSIPAERLTDQPMVYREDFRMALVYYQWRRRQNEGGIEEKHENKEFEETGQKTVRTCF